MTAYDVKYLTEFSHTFSGLSNVKDLAIRVASEFDPSKRKTWWGLPSEKDKQWEGGNKKIVQFITYFCH